MTLPILERARVVATPEWNRWLIPPAALSIHLAIGSAYAWSVFKSAISAPTASDLSGTVTAIPFQLAIVMLGLSAAIFGTRVEKNGPRWAMTVSLIFFVSGLLLSALGMSLGQFWLVIFGYGFVGGIGLGIGYISPVSTLMKWFPDRPGMATGIAIMGFGGGALIASPLTTQLLSGFGGFTDASIAKTFLVLAVGYAIFMALGVVLIRVPADDWKPKGWNPDTSSPLVSTHNVSAANAVKTPQFWLLWIVLCFNVTAGIGILERASGIYQDFFPDALSAESLAAAAAGFVAFLSLTNMIGRFVWSSVSDLVGRKNIYRLYLGVGALLYLYIAVFTNSNKVLFLISALLILSFYGAGFATMPAYLKDMFGTYQVGAIHGRLLTAWSVAGVLGPLIVNAIADAGDTGSTSRYLPAFYVMIALLVIGFVANELIKPVDEKFYEKEASA
ncbi:OFA family MFS transporter [Rhodococcus sp. BP-252]|uniref:OFA family MFS transporter n=1 Tax=unclassified Rhodococcus (in: high G+C Gram-positive bacteria) TaxID=192944 RepID=UPI001431FE6A|nr:MULTISPECIES: OFA family MFS transporter [unclassified Rhodococcus (in: high G+C Gram-positive bacteria)]MBY6411029.1 OFA family MFS transporter [Rhodococcus sp. BP-320]MBY6415688.1 OFA family MFS transporter [Rhodococcus sp. BP-321]MBY6420930.1 OFA family MFS transporter [Rhodococcus sp. BP-324]MBY6425985.1 OFA family MFS transporter [Rhodococcus sp. BP-323]MBY6430894.1 OFA family MFS transporter [Rhodococcus sp. BP-322]